VSVGGTKIILRPSLSESSRKFVTCVRKYLLLYLDLLERTGDMCTLEQAYTYLCTDKKVGNTTAEVLVGTEPYALVV
jgi:calcineurin-binding protein cabin-1